LAVFLFQFSPDATKNSWYCRRPHFFYDCLWLRRWICILGGIVLSSSSQLTRMCCSSTEDDSLPSARKQIWPVHLNDKNVSSQEDTFLSWHLAPASEVAGGHTLPFKKGQCLPMTYVMNLGTFCPLEKHWHILTPLDAKTKTCLPAKARLRWVDKQHRCLRVSKTERYGLSRFCFKMTRHATKTRWRQAVFLSRWRTQVSIGSKTRCQLSWKRCTWTA
jgi:hypothetical protein